MSSAVKSKNVKYYIHSAIAIAIMVFARYIPVPYPFTRDGMLVLGVLIGFIYALVNGNLFWGSILALFMVGTSDVISVGGILSAVMSNGTVMFLIALFMFVAYLGSVGFARTLALKIIQSNVTKGRPWVLTLFLLLGAFIPASLMSITAVFLIVLPILYEICDEVGMEKTERWPMLTSIGIGVALALSLGFWPFQAFGSILSGQLVAGGYDGGVPFVQWVLYMTVINGICLAATVLIIRLLKPDVSKLHAYTPPAEKVKFNSDQKFALLLVGLLLALFTVPQFLPAGSAPRVFFTQFGPFAIVSFLLALGAFLRKDGKPRIDIAMAAAKGLVIWPLVIMVGTVLVIADILTREDLGFVAFIVQRLGPIFDVGNVVFFTLIVLAIAFVITTFVQGGLVIAIMFPVLVPIALSMGFPMMQIIAPFAAAVNVGLVLPSSHALAALMHGQEHIGPKNIMKYIPLFMVVTFVLVALIGIPLALVMF